MTWREQWSSFEHGHRVALIALGVCVIFIVYLAWKVNSAQGAEARAALAETNERALADSTRKLNNVITQRDSTLNQYQRLVVQQTQKADDIDAALGEMRRFATSLTFAVATKTAVNQASTGATTETASGSRLGTFDVHDAPYNLHAVVTLPTPPAKGAIDASFSLDPFGFGARLGCTNKVNALGMRDAMLTLTDVPSWLKPTITHVEQDPSICPSPVLQKDLSADDRSRWSIFVGYGYTFPSPAWRASAGIALTKPLPCPQILRKRLYGC